MERVIDLVIKRKRKEVSIEMAKNMIEIDKLSFEEIAECTELSIEEIKQIAYELKNEK